MPRISFKHEDNKGSYGFQEGNVHILYSRAVAFQFPPNKQTGEQSDAFPALVWRGVKCDQEWNDTEEEFEVILRMGGFDQFHIGKVAPKDFDNKDAEPEDLGSAVGTEGNTFSPQGNVLLPRDWARMEESLRKQGFKPEIAARGITTDFEGTKLHLKTEQGEPYIAKKGKNKGKEVTPTYFVATRVHTFGYDKAAKPKANGAAAAEDGTELLKGILADPSPTFTAAVSGKTLKRDDFRKLVTQECFRKGIKTPQQKQVVAAIGSDEVLTEVGIALMDTPGAFSIEGSETDLKLAFA